MSVTQARLTLAAAGDMENRINVINPRFQAEALRMLRGCDVGVINGSFWTTSYPTGLERSPNPNKMWKCTVNSASDVAIGPGMATAYGFDIKNEETVHLSLAVPASGSKQYFIFLEWDLSTTSEGKGYIKVHDNGTSASWTPTYQQNLIDAPTGKYQMPLHRVQVTSSGAATKVYSWDAMGVKTICYPLRAEYATEADGWTSTGALKAKLDEIDGRLDRLGFSRGAIQLFGTEYSPDSTTCRAASNGIYRQGNYVIGRINKTGIQKSISQYSHGEVIGSVLNAVFAPRGSYAFTFLAKYVRNDGFVYIAKCYVHANGYIYFDELITTGATGTISTLPSMTLKGISIEFAYEALPREE